MKADLHLHSFYSDGAHSPAELAEMGKRAGLGVMALTDHDSMGGSDEFSLEAERRGILPVRGWEVSAYEGEGKVHILGYGCVKNDAYCRYHALRCEKEEVRIREVFARANDFFGTRASFEEFAEGRKGPLLEPYHVTHVAVFFSELLGLPVGEVFRRALGFGMPAYVPDWRVTPEEGIALIRACGGVVVLAHPGRVNLLTSEEYADFCSCGEEKRAEYQTVNLARRQALIDRLAPKIDGIEAVYSKHTPEERSFYADYAERHNLFVTGGSDFHAAGSPSVGCVPFDAGEELLKKLKGGC